MACKGVVGLIFEIVVLAGVVIGIAFNLVSGKWARLREK